jgi:hypothetical protein
VTRVVIEGTPGWVTLAGYLMSGVLAAAGVIVGQRIAANRDDRRWQRERDREGERWKREEERQWLVDRREAYAGLHAAVQAWHTMLLGSWSAWKVRGQVEDDFRERKATVKREFEAARGLVDLLAPKPIRRDCRMLGVRLDMFGHYLRKDDTTRDKAETDWARLVRAEKELLRRLREDLGIVDVDEPQSREETPPTDK